MIHVRFRKFGVCCSELDPGQVQLHDSRMTWVVLKGFVMVGVSDRQQCTGD